MGDWRIGVDVGGSFTDLVAFNTRSKELKIEKVPTVKANPAVGVLDALTKLEHDVGVSGSDVDAFLHGTTIGTNALLEMKGARVGLIVTEGFRAIPQVQAGSQPRPFLLFYHRPEGLAHPVRIKDVPERVDKSGEVITPLDVEATRQVVRALKDDGVTSIAVSFLFSYANPAHEQMAKQVIEEEFPDCIISLSSEIMPRIREWPRMSTTLVNAYLEPVLTAYLRSLDQQLAELDVTTSQRFLMQSNGGVMPFSAAIRGGRTHHTLMSGPAAGVVSAAFLCATQGFRNLVSLDIGGTSADVAFVEGGVPVEVTQGQIEGRTVYAPMVDVESVSAGGGTIARVDSAGLLRVGPDSAGSDPGPACYGRGGTEATITDADMALGYLEPSYFLGGAMTLDPAASERALMKGVGKPLGSSNAQEAAWGVVKIIEVKMADRILALAAEKGISLREFTLVAGGGAGPLHSAGVADELGIQRIIVPPHPGAFSALGLLCSDVVHDYVWTSVSELESTPVEELNRQFARLEEQAIADVEEEGLSVRRARLKREADVRYVGQGFELSVPVRKGTLTDSAKRDIRKRFEARHKKLYGHSAPNEAVEIVSFRIRTVVPTPKLQTGRDGVAPAKRSAAQPSTHKPMYFGAGPVSGAVYYRSELTPGERLDGPAVVYQEDSTTIVPPGWRAEVDLHANIVMTRR